MGSMASEMKSKKMERGKINECAQDGSLCPRTCALTKLMVEMGISRKK